MFGTLLCSTTTLFWSASSKKNVTSTKLTVLSLNCIVLLQYYNKMSDIKNVFLITFDFTTAMQLSLQLTNVNWVLVFDDLFWYKN